MEATNIPSTASCVISAMVAVLRNVSILPKGLCANAIKDFLYKSSTIPRCVWIGTSAAVSLLVLSIARTQREASNAAAINTSCRKEKVGTAEPRETRPNSCTPPRCSSKAYR